MDPTSSSGSSPTINLQTLVATVQQAVQAQNLIATNIKALTTILAEAFPLPIEVGITWTPGGIANGATAAVSFSVSGTTVGQFVKSSLNEDLQGCQLSAYVQSTNTVFATINNNTGGTVTFANTTVNVSIAST